MLNLLQKLNHKKAGTNINILHARKDSDIIKEKLIKFLLAFEWKCISIVVEKENQNIDYHKQLEILLKNINIKEKIFLTSPNTQIEFRKKILNLNSKININTPAQENTLQIADFLAWIIFQKFERNNDHYFDKLKDKIIILENSKTPM